MTESPHSSHFRIALLGGEALRPESTPLWRELLMIGGSTPQVAIVPFALAKMPLSQLERRTQITRDRLIELGAQAEIIAPSDESASLNRTQIVYLPGGDQRVVCEMLPASGIWQSIQQSTDILLIAASGGAAVAFGKQAFAPVAPYPAGLDDLAFEILPGLGLLRDAIVLPYYSWLQDQVVERIRALAPESKLLGIDDQAAIISHPNGWQVAGHGTVSVFRHKQPPAIFDPGQTIPPEILAPYS
jgi:hypothetical protein